ncbi:MAG: 50S ribosomal protein L11 methyltransferase [Kiritimatiellae bacterium]|nr:50S ribosomal protein L11 methyltransferase [Kiritimatiellia bacterium]
MTKVHCSVPERYVNPLFEVFDGGDFVLSSYHDIELPSTEMQIFLPGAEAVGDARRRLSEALAVVGCDASVEVSEVPDEDWKFAYRRHFRTERVSERIWTHPPWEPCPEAREGDVVVTLDPGLAFGTGKHETTKACLQYIDELAGHGSPGLSFLDMGCGSGILSIAAAKLGFSPVAGFDIDEDAVAASKENAAANGVGVSYRVFALGGGSVTLDESIEAAKGVYPDLALQGRANAADLPRFEPADVVVANILGPLLVAFAEEIAGYAKRHLVVSGILDELYPEVLSAFVARGFREVSRKSIGEWTTGRLVRNGA